MGVYDMAPSALFSVDLMGMLAAVGRPPVTILFRTSGAPRPEAPMNRVTDVGAGRTVIQTTSFNDPAFVELVRSQQPDLLVYAGGRDLLKAPILEAARLGCLGGHYGRLPAIRGMGTVEWSVIEGIPPTVAIQRMTPGVDAGDVMMQAAVTFGPEDSFTQIRERSYFMTKSMLAFSASALLSGRFAGSPQNLAEGKQYYRLGPDMQKLAERRLGRWFASTGGEKR